MASIPYTTYSWKRPVFTPDREVVLGRFFFEVGRDACVAMFADGDMFSPSPLIPSEVDIAAYQQRKDALSILRGRPVTDRSMKSRVFRRNALGFVAAIAGIAAIIGIGMLLRLIPVVGGALAWVIAAGFIPASMIMLAKMLGIAILTPPYAKWVDDMIEAYANHPDRDNVQWEAKKEQVATSPAPNWPSIKAPAPKG
jgi:hypothetical protein